MYIKFIDIKKVFDCVIRTDIYDILSIAGIPFNFIEILSEMQKMNESKLIFSKLIKE